MKKKLFTTLFLSIFLFFPALIIAQNVIDVTFRYTPNDNAVRSFVPGEFNNWGNNTAGQIDSEDGSLLTVDDDLGFSYQVIELEVGGGTATYQGASGYAYKFHEHYDQAGSQWEWFTDPINPIAIGQNNDSFVEVTHPLIFQIEPAQGSVTRDDPPGIAANVAAMSSDPINPAASEIYVNEEFAGNFTGYYETERQLLMVPSIDDLGIDLEVGTNSVRIVAVTDDGQTIERTSSFTFIATPDVVEQPRPAGLEDGITYHEDDPSTISFSLFAPGKEFVHVIGDHSDWEVREEYLMKRDNAAPDSVHYWITIEDFTPGETYRFQYLIDGEIRMADLFSELVVHPTLDEFISEDVYPNMPEYPHGLTTEIVTVIEPGREAYEWEVPDFERPEVDGLVIYETLLRDFVEHSTYETLTDTLDYFENLGVNVIELMPVQEFDGNLSWGYNPVFHGALDKSYGPRHTFKRFVDEAHKRGIAVVLDVVYNHAHENSPLIRLYGANRENNRFIGPGHAFNVFQHLNHDDPYIQYWVDRMNRYWLETYNVDGYRFDLTKGFATNVQDGSLLQGPNPERIENLKRMYDVVRTYDDDAYMILEHFADNNEERELEEHGMMLWGNHNFNYSEGVMGWNQGNNSNMSGIYFRNRNFSNPHLVGYMESHDEQWMMHKARNFGNQENPDHDIREDLDVALQRMKLAGSFFFTIPGPKMLWMFGELGYGWGDGECVKPGDGSDGDCAPSDPGRTAEKPIRWEYFEEENRHRLYRSWGELTRLRNSSPAFTSRDTDFSSSLGGEFKWIRLEHNDMDAVIVGNFGVFRNSGSVDFPDTGEWYEFVTGETKEIESVSQEFSLAPAEIRIYTSRHIEPAADNVFFQVGEDGFEELPDNFVLSPNYPNPFNSSTQLDYVVPEQSSVTIEVYDVLGRKITTLLNEPEHPQGQFNVTFDASGLSSGVYIARLVSGNESLIQKMMLIK